MNNVFLRTSFRLVISRTLTTTVAYSIFIFLYTLKPWLAGITTNYVLSHKV